MIYGPNEDGKVSNKDKFWKTLAKVVEGCRKEVYVVGQKHEKTNNVLATLEKRRKLKKR